MGVEGEGWGLRVGVRDYIGQVRGWGLKVGVEGLV